ncbi:MAG: T9SS type A sorting domain-containing protein [Chitinivibrionales bacterium]|nr:T9SS type A sorting domain-containing protein [Chitinivibrionales bacterium]
MSIRCLLFHAAATALLYSFFAYSIPSIPENQHASVTVAEEVPGTISESHSSTLVEANDGSLVVAWYQASGGETGAKIYLNRKTASGWGNRVKVGDDGNTNRNPVLFQPSNGPMLLYYHVGDDISSWRGYVKTSSDNGITWSSSKQLPSGYLGPIKNKPVELPDGTLLMGSSTESGHTWKVHMEKAPEGQYDGGTGWSKTGDLSVEGNNTEWGCIQPTILNHGNGKYQILCRGGASSPAYPFSAFSENSGNTWSSLSVIPDSPDAIYSPTRGGTGFDGVTLENGKHVLIANSHSSRRAGISLYASDNGLNWTKMVEFMTPDDFPPNGLERINPGSYSAVIQTSDGMIHTTFTALERAKILHFVVDPSVLGIGDATVLHRNKEERLDRAHFSGFSSEKIEIYSLDGRNINKSLNTAKQSLSGGVYLLKVASKNGHSVHNKMIIQ